MWPFGLSHEWRHERPGGLSAAVAQAGRLALDRSCCVAEIIGGKEDAQALPLPMHCRGPDHHRTEKRRLSPASACICSEPLTRVGTKVSHIEMGDGSWLCYSNR